MKRKQLESYLSQLQLFSSPKRSLEQYHTPYSIAAEFIHIVDYHNTLEGLHVLDIGAGTGMLSIGCLLQGADRITSIEICPEAVETFKTNIDQLEIHEDCIEIIQDDAIKFITTQENTEIKTINNVDIVIMNPPFGCSLNENIDKDFLKVAWKLSQGPVFIIPVSYTHLTLPTTPYV